MIVEFPCESGEDAVLAKDMTAVQQLELVKKLQTLWADNAISVTVYYKKDELPAIKQWLSDNYDTAIKSVSFLLHSEHGFTQAPYEEISEEKYLALTQKLKPIQNMIDAGKSTIDFLECVGGACPIK